MGNAQDERANGIALICIFGFVIITVVALIVAQLVELVEWILNG